MTYKTKTKELVRIFFSENKDKDLSVEEICEALIPKGCAKSSVYRIISSMTKSGELKRTLDEVSGRIGYRFIMDRECTGHLHMKCNGCGAVLHLGTNETRELLNSVLKSEGFSVDKTTMLYGVCSDCMDKSPRSFTEGEE